MEFLLNRFRNLTALLVVVMAQLLLLAYQVKSNREVRLIRVWSVTAVTPVAKVLEVVRQNTIGVVENYFVLINVREENRKLSEELGKLKMDNHFLKSQLETAERAQALQAFQARTPSRTVPARVIGTGTGANSRVVYVDQGTGAGIMKGMAVVTPDGIVGKVLESYPTASQVLLVTDSTFGAGVISQKNRVHGTLKGLGQSKCSVDYVENEEKGGSRRDVLHVGRRPGIPEGPAGGPRDGSAPRTYVQRDLRRSDGCAERRGRSADRGSGGASGHTGCIAGSNERGCVPDAFAPSAFCNYDSSGRAFDGCRSNAQFL
jgi:cell shape-determining protein MreC